MGVYKTMDSRLKSESLAEIGPVPSNDHRTDSILFK